MTSEATTSRKWGFSCKSPLVARDHAVTGHLQRAGSSDEEVFAYEIAIVTHEHNSKRASGKNADFILQAIENVGGDAINSEVVPLKQGFPNWGA